MPRDREGAGALGRCSGGRPTGAAHSSDYSMWRESQYASNGLRDFAERGEAWALMKEIQAAGEQLQSVHEVFSAPAVPSGTGQTSTEFEVHARHSLVSGGQRRQGRGVCCAGRLAEHLAPQVSFVVRIVPSPDWFVGVDSLDLCDGDRWREQVTMDLYPHDAGTDSGFTFSSPNFATIPQDTVTEVRGPNPSGGVCVYDSTGHSGGSHSPALPLVQMAPSTGSQRAGCRPAQEGVRCTAAA